MTHDTGFAPNPFWGYCTLAACTPNHRGIRPQIGDWIIGTGAIDKGNKLIYAMQISLVMCFDKYYTDRRFKKKIPVIKSGDWRRRCGDNIYYKDNSNKWQQHPSIFHNEPRNRMQDLKHPYVFIAKRFYYFGCNAEKIPSKYNSLALRRQGVKCNHASKVAEGFLTWLQDNNPKMGILGKPCDSGLKPEKCSQQPHPCGSKSMHHE
jgi:hypothetical protein